MSFDKYINKAKKLANDPKVREKLNSEKAEKASDSILDKAAGVAESLTNGKHTEKIQKARDAADRAIGTDGNSENQQPEDERAQGDQTGGQSAGEPSQGERPEDSGPGEGNRYENRRDGEGGPRP
ncbi:MULTISPECIES: antitoxin [Brevibacterium]|uniref:MT0933-like antitoxin protein n=2 Tax=Brevibacterium TaxID=1696 RepID=A0A1H1VZM8_BRESA|nr:antitoxin [Brevibacterium sandarakinum]SDS89539.1 MT0933-like antitoxin protein [Brevibacterium sandarakinum]